MPGRLVGVSKDADGAPGVPAGAADPRAAHPPREGDQQHLHRAGAARRRRRHVRRLPRPGRAARDRSADALATRPRSPPGCGRSRASRSCTTRSSTPSWPVRRVGPTPSSPRPASAGSTCASSTPTTSAITTDETTTREHLAAVWAAFGADADESDADRLARRGPAARRDAAPRRGAHPPGVPRAPVRDRDAALPAPALGPRPGPGPLDDPARLVHDEAQRHRRDGADHLAGVRGRAPVRAGRAGRRLPRADRQLESWLVRGDRLRRRLAAAERGLAGRAVRAAGDPRLPPGQRPARRATSA